MSWKIIAKDIAGPCQDCRVDFEVKKSLLHDPHDDEVRLVCQDCIEGERYNIIDSNETEKNKPSENQIQMIGCDDVKREIDLLLRRVKGQKRLQDSGKISIQKPSLHMIFTGGPGTGKTEYARRMAKQLFEMGYIRKNHFVETDRSGLIGEHVGKTAQKVIEKVNSALGGILFIDEAYAIFSQNASDAGNTYSHEAVATLLKAMEDNRDKLVVIMAGYEADMQRMLSTNDGFRSRFSYHIRFRDYTPEEIRQITDQNLTFLGYDTTLIQNHLRDSIAKVTKGGFVPGNARWARNFCDKVTMEHMVRVGEDEHADITQIIPEDVQRASGMFRMSADIRDGLDAIREEAQQKLNQMIGLSEIKLQLTSLMNFLSVQKMKEDSGIFTASPSLHMFFKGSPGTGKTTVARIIGQFLKGSGILENGHLVEVTKTDFVSGVVGDTSRNVRDLVQKAMGGVLFIDEAYALAKDRGGREVIDELIKQMEEHRNELVIIFAGYENDMERLLAVNDGLRSRIPHYFTFPDYTEEELIQIAQTTFEENQITLDSKTKKAMKTKISSSHIHGNGRWIRNFTEKLIMVQSDRIVRDKSTDLKTIHVTDIEETFQRMNTTA